MGLKEVLFRKSDLKIAQEAHEARQAIAARAEAGIERLRGRHAAALAEVESTAEAIKVAEAASVAAVLDGGEAHDLEPLREQHRHALDKERAIAAAIAAAERGLEPLLLNRVESFKKLSDERLEIAALKVRAALIALIGASYEVGQATNPLCNHPYLAIPWIDNETLTNWDRVHQSWSRGRSR